MKTRLAKRDSKPVQKSLPDRLTAAPGRTAFFRFTYSHREISQSGGQTRVRSREYRFENGKLESEEFEGTLDGSAYRSAVERAHSLMSAQTKSFLGVFSVFLPFKSKW